MRIDIPNGVTRGLWPVTFGVPFPDKTLRPDMPVVVTANGTAVPTQTTPLATWAKDGRFVRWLLVDFQVDAATAQQTKYVLHFGKDAPLLAKAKDILVKRNGDRLVVDTGAAEYVLRDRGAFRIESVKVRTGGSLSRRVEFVSPESPARFTVTDHKGATYEATGDLNPQGAAIEDQGACRIGLKSEGWYVSAKGEKFCKHIIRLEFFAGSSIARVLHTFIFTGTSESHQIRDIAMELPTTLKSKVVGRLGTAAGDPSVSISALQPDPIHLTQDCEDRWHLKFKAARTDSGKELAAGERAGGWGRMAGMKGMLTVALRDPWQNYPYELEVDDGTFFVHFWPKHGRLMDLRTEALLAPYGEDGIGIIDRFFLSRRKPYKRSIFDVYNNAMGMAKTHEVWIDFSAGGSPDRMQQIITQANHPVLATAEPAWNCASEALGPIQPYDPQGFPWVEEGLEAMFDRFVNWQRHFMDYGWFDHGDIHCGARDWDHGVRFAGGRTATLWRYWDSTHYGFPNAPWLYWFRTGKRKYLEFAEANARHCIDIDRCHHGDGENRYKGGHYYCDWSIIQWNRRTETHINYNKLEYMLYYYYMRGYRRGLKAMKDWAELSMRYYKNGKGRDPLQMIRPPRFKNMRHYGPPMGNLIELYRATWDERYLNAAKDWAKALVDMYPKKNDDWKNMGAAHYCWQAMSNYLRLIDDPALRKAFEGYARHDLGGNARYGSVGDTSEGYFLTRDPLFLDVGKARLLGLLSKIGLSDDPRARGAAGSWTCGWYPYVMRTIPVLLAGMASAPAEWREQNFPLVATNRSMHMAGPRHPTLHVKPAGGGKAVVRLRLAQKQAFDLKDATGKVLRRVEASFPTRVDTIELPDGAGEMYTVSFPLRPTRHTGDYIDRGNVDLYTVKNAKLAVAPCTEDGKFCVFGPRFYFMVPEGEKEFTIEVDTQTTWAAYGWFPTVSVYRPDGSTAETKKGPGLIRFILRPKPAQTGKLWSLGPLGRVSAPTPNKSWAKPMRPVAEHFPAYFKLSRNLPQFVSTHPDLFFIPQMQE